MRKAANSLDPIANRPGEFGAWIRALKPGRPPAVACTRQNGDGGEGQRTSTGAGAEASLRGHLKAESGEQTGSQSYIPPDPKDDKALHTALDLIRGIQKNSAYPPNPKTAVPN
jgi:hypothetical protein